MKKRIFLRVFVVILLSFLLIFTAGVWQVHRNSEHVTRERLYAEARFLSVMICDADDISKLTGYENEDELRLTLTDSSGKVIYDSGNGELCGADYSSRKEVASALSGVPTVTERYSDTYRCYMTYYAVSSVLDDGETIVIRLSVRNDDIGEYLLMTVPFLIITFTLSIVLSVFLAKRLSEDISAKMGDVGQSLKSVNEGQYRPLDTNKSDAELNSVLCQINDLNEKTHRHIQSEITERQKLSMVLDNVAEGIIALDKDKKIIFANNSAYRIFGIGKECVGEDCAYIFDDAIINQLDRNGNEIRKIEYSRADREYTVTMKKIKNVVPDTNVFLIVVINDVTKEKQMVKEKSDFFENASHELKTPITVIRGHSELLLSKGTLGGSEGKQVDRIYKECVRLSKLISDMLKLSQLEKSKDETEISDVDLYALCSEAVAELDKLIKEKNIDCSITGEGSVKADPDNIYELIINLCTNAVKYNKDGGKLMMYISKESNGDVTLRVQDTGIGVEKEHIPRLCERFYRVDKSRSKKTGGTGLGLAIVKHICVLYGAQLSIDSEPRVGTCVSVRFKR